MSGRFYSKNGQTPHVGVCVVLVFGVVFLVWFDLVFGVWCLVFGVWCLVFGVWCLVFGVR